MTINEELKEIIDAVKKYLETEDLATNSAGLGGDRFLPDTKPNNETCPRTRQS